MNETTASAILAALDQAQAENNDAFNKWSEAVSDLARAHERHRLAVRRRREAWQHLLAVTRDTREASK